MPRAKQQTQSQLVPKQEPEPSPENIFDDENFEASEDYFTAPVASPAEGGLDDSISPPHIFSPQWSDYVLSQLTEDEKPDGNPTTEGLRRVAQLLLGPITSSYVDIKQVPEIDNRNRTTVVYTVTLLWLRNDERNGLYINFTDAADVSRENTDHPFSLHPVGTAVTRAEGRALRKALGLRKVIAAEEVAKNVSEESENHKQEEWKPVEERISDVQVNAIDTICKRCDINVMKFINSGELKYGSIRDVPASKAPAMIKWVNTFYNKEIPDEIKGYDENWRNS